VKFLSAWCTKHMNDMMVVANFAGGIKNVLFDACHKQSSVIHFIFPKRACVVH